MRVHGAARIAKPPPGVSQPASQPAWLTPQLTWRLHVGYSRYMSVTMPRAAQRKRALRDPPKRKKNAILYGTWEPERPCVCDLTTLISVASPSVTYEAPYPFMRMSLIYALDIQGSVLLSQHSSLIDTHISQLSICIPGTLTHSYVHICTHPGCPTRR